MISRVTPSLVAATMFLGVNGLVAAAFLLAVPVRSPLAAETAIRPWEMGALGVAIVLLGALLIRRVNVRMVVELLLGFLLLLGVWFYAWQVFGDAGLLLAGALTILQAWVRTAWAHNALMMVGAAGTILYLAFLFPPLTWGVILVGLAVYDTVAGRTNRVSDRFAQTVIHRGIVPFAVIPAQGRGLGEPFIETVRQKDTMVFGVVELVLPGLFVAQAAVVGGGVISWVIVATITAVAAWCAYQKRAPLLPLAGAAILPFLFVI